MIPLMLKHLSPMPNVSDFKEMEIFFENSHFDGNVLMNINAMGMPLYAALSKTPPTTCTTPGKTLPAGYTKTGKYKPSRWTPSKTDKRAGK